MHSLKPYSCPKCNLSFAGKDASRFNVNKFPRILTCYHSICESCLQKSLKEKGGICCSLCKETVKMSPHEDMASKFMPDIQALGIYCANIKNYLPNFKMKTVPLNSAKSKVDESCPTVQSVVCGQCNKADALWRCKKCQLNFCNQCFDIVHSDSNLMEKHVGEKILPEQYKSMVQEGCKLHNKTIEFFCEVDEQLTCSFCMLVGDHIGHEVKTLMDKNESSVPQLKESIETLTEMYQILKYTDHLLSEKIPKEKVDISDKIKTVHETFHKLHTVLQIRENEIITNLTEASQLEITPLEEMRTKVASLQRDLIAIKSDVESVIKSPCLALSAPSLVKKMEEIKDWPCYLVPISEENKEEIDISVKLDSELEEKIQNFGSVDYNIKPRHSLLSRSELPEKFSTVIPEDFVIKLPNICASSDIETSSTADTFSEDSLLISPEPKNNAIRDSFKFKDFGRMQPDQVKVSFLKNPSSFYIQRCRDLRKIRNMFDAMDKWGKTIDGRKPIPASVVKGDLYLVKRSPLKKWYRARVKNIILPEEDEETIGKLMAANTTNGKVQLKPRETQIEVFLIDFGDTEIVSQSHMRPMQNKFLNFPGIAKECSLIDIQPTSGKNWCTEAIKTFKDLVHKETLIMQVQEERNNILYVDLKRLGSEEISNDGPSSIRDALVFLELAVFPSGIVNRVKRKKDMRRYMPPEILQVNVNIPALVSHVDDPSNLFIQQLSTASYMSKLIFDMNEEYKNTENSLHYSVHVPYIGMMCAVQFSADKQWYRAEIIGLPGGALVDVKYVDFGNREVVHHQYLRKLFDRFSKLNIQAIPCKLAHVTYNQRKYWDPEVKKWLTKQVSNKHMTLKSLGMIPGENKAEIVLYYKENELDICVNALMVEAGFAESNGEFSKTIYFKTETSAPDLKAPYSTLINSYCKESVPQPIEPCSQSHIVDSPPFSVNQKNAAEKSSFSNNNSPNVSPKKSHIEKKYPTLAAPELDPTKSVDVCVSHIESPGVFYVRIVKSENKLNELMEEIQKVYSNSSEDVKECVIGKSYVIYSPKENKFYRGTAISKVSDDVYNVYYVDYGRKEEVNKNRIKIIHNDLASEEAFCIECHLDGLQPTGDISKWSQTACDTFRRLVEPHEELVMSVFVEVDVGKAISSLPCDLLILKVVRGGALEPSTIETISISSALVEQGLAFRQRRKPTSVEINKETVSQKNSKNEEIQCLDVRESKIEDKSEKKNSELENEVSTENDTHNRNEQEIFKEESKTKVMSPIQTKTEVQPPADKIPTELSLDTVLIDSSVNNAPIKPPVDSVPINPPVDSVPINPPVDSVPINPPVDSVPINPPVDSLLIKPPVDVPIKSPIDAPIDPPIKAPVLPKEPKFVWLPTVPPQETKFTAHVTNVTEEGCLQFYMKKEGSCQLDILTQALQFKCNRQKHIPLIEPPAIGEACIAKFSVDKQWYRAEVIDVYTDKIKVNFVDYGNNENVLLEDIRLDIILNDFPRQSLECVLFELKDANILWDNDLLIFLHNQIVETDVNMEVKGPIEKNRKLECSVTTISGLNIAELLFQMGFNENIPEDSPNYLHEPELQLEPLKTFAKPKELYTEDVFPVCITQVNGNIVYMQLLEILNPKSEQEEEHNAHHKAFLQMLSDLREKADSFPVVKYPVLTMACCAQYEYDKDWYRCEVTELSENSAQVLYVDYGNSETVPLENLRELGNWYIEFPVQLHFCELNGVAPVTGEWSPELNNEMTEALITSNRNLFAKVKVPGKITKVDIFVKDEDSYKLAYDELIKKNLIVVDKL